MTLTLEQPRDFDLTGPLPTGTTVLEASAGTGKTHAIAALATRHLAEGLVRIDEVMMVTFSRAATSELRSRTYLRLRQAVGALDAFLDQGTAPDDPVDALLCEGPPEGVRGRRDRLAEALAEIDQATIATTHEFCQRMLSELGLLADHDHTVRFSEDIGDLAEQVVHDVYLAEQVDRAGPPPGRLATFTRFAQVGRAALREVDLPVEPAEAQGLSAERVAFAHRVRERLEERKRLAGVYTFDDMVNRLRDALTHPATGTMAAERLAGRFPLVMIDEFQDTDPVQWQVVREAFVGRCTVILIGDPKQSIYAFRGADVNAYLEAVACADRVFGLGTNHRSDAGVVGGVGELFAGVAMGDRRIVAHPVRARHQAARLRGPNPAPAVQVRLVGDGTRPTSGRAAARTVDQDLAREVVGLLEDGWELDDGHGWRPLRPSDIAVLVRTNRRGEQVTEALESCGISAVFGGASSVMASEAAMAWLHLLRALVQPSTQAMKRAALGCLVGWSEVELAAAVADDGSAATGRTLSDLAVLTKTLARVLSEQGVAGVFEVLCDRTELYERLLARPDGERVMTDVRHLSQLLNDQVVRHQLTPTSLVQWLADRIREARRGTDDDRTRRLETDTACVQVLTVHAAKGLEFPVVLLPQAASEWRPTPRQGDATVLHLDGRRVLDVGVDADWSRRQELRLAQEQSESLRSLYVAATRASSRLVLWWAATTSETTGSALHRLLFDEHRLGQEVAAGPALPDSPRAAVKIPASQVELVTVEPRPARRWQAPPPQATALEARVLGRSIDTSWRRTSYSGLTQDLHDQRKTWVEAAVPSEADGLVLDERESEAAGLGAEAADLPGLTGSAVVTSRLAPLPGGTQFGTLVHAVLEQVDTRADDLDAEIRERVRHELARMPIDGVDEQSLVTGLSEVLHTPLGRVADGLSLAQVAPADRLAELDFELPMGPRGRARPNRLLELAQALQDPELTGGDAFAARYGAHLEHSGVRDATLHGFLTGSIDAVLRTSPGGGDAPGAAGDEVHFWVVDYKTNRIPVPPGGELTSLHYHPEAMADLMVEAHYPLQALLYCVALHRFLAWRLPGYRPEHHLGGVGYLFVRGMAGPGTPVVDGIPCGVFTWLPRPQLVVQVSDLIGGQR